MKRSLSILSVFVLFAFLFTFSFAPVVKAAGNETQPQPAQTTENQNTNTQTTDKQNANTTEQQTGQQTEQKTEQTNDQAVTQEKAKKEKQYKIRLRLDANVDENGNVKPFVVAKLIDKTDKEVGQVEGTWTVEVDGKVVFTKENSTDKRIKVDLPEEFNVVVVKFEGKIDGQDVQLKKKHEVINADVEITHKVENGKDVFTATIKGAEKAEGVWYLGYGKEDSEEATDEVIAEGGATFTHAFENVKPGKYLVVAVFAGTINDGDYVVVGNTMEFVKDDDGSGKVTQPPKGGDEPKPPVLPSDEIDKAKKGGKLPKTATTYPVGALAGLVLLLVGFTALKLRRA